MEVILIGILFLIILVIGHELGHFFAAKFFGLRVDEFGFGFPPRLFSKKNGETRYSFNLLPFGGFVRIHGEHSLEGDKLEDPERSFTHQTAWKRAVIVMAGAFMNFLIGWFAFSIVFSIGVANRVVIESVADNSPAAEAGISRGDIIEGFESAEAFVVYVADRAGEEVAINEKTVIPRENPPEGEGALGVVVTDVGIARENPVKSLWLGLRTAALTTWAIVLAFSSFIWSILGGNFGAVGQFSGPVGVFSMIGDASSLGLAPLIQFLGLISLNLVVLNMIPFPALDGGRFLNIVVEKIIRRRLSQKFEMAMNAFGLFLLLLLMVVVTIKDIINIL